MFGVLLASLSNETLDFEKHHCKTHGFGEKKRARNEKRRPWKEKATPNWEKDPSRKKNKNRVPYVTFFCSPGLQNWRQNGPRNLEKAVFDIFFQYEKKQKFADAVFLRFLTFPGGANPQNRAKTMYCRSKSRVAPFPRETQTLQKYVRNWPPQGPQKPWGSPKNHYGTHSNTMHEKT